LFDLASLTAAYEALPDKTKAFIADKEMEHPYPYSGKNLGGMTGRKLDVVIHPMVRDLVGGQKALFISPLMAISSAWTRRRAMRSSRNCSNSQLAARSPTSTNGGWETR
jgi:hypothetical protein